MPLNAVLVAGFAVTITLVQIAFGVWLAWLWQRVSEHDQQIRELKDDD